MTIPEIDAPDWFEAAVAVEPTESLVEVDGVPIHYLQWGDTSKPGLVLVHGGAAHAHWWSHIAPLLTDRHSVVALDMSGHGDSGRRDDYRLDNWCDEVAAVADDAGFTDPPILVGHSMGGMVTVATAARHPDRVSGAIIIDSPIIAIDPEVEAARAGVQFKNPKTYDDPEIAIARFRTVPEQDVYLPYVKDHVARRSLHEIDDGWTWKFDPGIFLPRRAQTAELLPEVQCRVALLRAEHGLVTPDIGAYMYEQLGRVAPVVELPTAGHHPMLDVPLLLVTAIRSLLADWDHSIPRKRDQSA